MFHTQHLDVVVLQILLNIFLLLLLQFTVNYPYECITSVGGSYADTQPYQCIVLRSLTFKTSSGRTSVIGKETGTTFLLESQGNAIVGVHGRVGACVDSIGTYYSMFSPSPPLIEKLEGQGGDGGDSWDDGAFLNVKKVYIGQGEFGIVSVKFEYENDASEVVVGDEHGNATLLGYEEVMITPLLWINFLIFFPNLKTNLG